MNVVRILMFLIIVVGYKNLAFHVLCIPHHLGPEQDVSY